MKQHLIILSIALTLTTIFVSNVNAEEKKETCPLHLQTDKKLYVSGESISFKCVLSPAKLQTSSILFVDICGEGYLLSSYILKAENGCWNGEVSIPDSVQTGVYLLRAYLGNKQGNPLITSQPISILSRFGKNEKNEIRKIDASYQSLNQLNTLEPSGELLRTYAQTDHCLPGGSLKFWIENDLRECDGGISFSVFKVEDGEQSETNVPANYSAYTSNDEVKIYENYTVRGMIRSVETQEPVRNEIVYFSIPDSIAQIKYDFTDAEGIFRFHLNDYTPNQEVIIQTRGKSTSYNIKLYPSQLIPPKQIPFFIPTEVEKSEFAQLAIQRATLHKAYIEVKQEELPRAKYRYPFYGIAQSRVIPDKYVDLTDFKEIAWEILPLVKYRQIKDSTSLKIWSQELNIVLFNPMMLVDGVPVSSPASLNVLNSKSIKWIDIQPQIRCYGNMLFEGLINVQTYKGDFSEVELPLNAIETELEKFYNPKKDKQIQPLFRDVLYWDPYIDPSKKVYQIDVPCSYEKGKYIAIAQSFDDKGKLNRSVFQFEVTN